MQDIFEGVVTRVRFDAKDPDLSTIARRIERGTIDLQPDFQRGEVWSKVKKQRLIDSILRRWHVPPVHLVAKGGGKFDVLDGQQRLTAVRDFIDGVFPIDGRVEPRDPVLEALHGLRYTQLPDEIRDEFDTYAIRIFELHDFRPEEPYELFFRLNQPTSLTEAEKRNAFVGGPRNQVKELVNWATERGMTSKRVGFSNARMSYDDVVSRFLLTLEQESLAAKVTASRVTDRYRKGDSFDKPVLARAREALGYYLALPMLEESKAVVRPNKATMHTWLCVATELSARGVLESHGSRVADAIGVIERVRWEKTIERGTAEQRVLDVLQDRSTARVADVSSVVLRDLACWMLIAQADEALTDALPMVRAAVAAWERVMDSSDVEAAMLQVASESDWSERKWL